MNFLAGFLELLFMVCAASLIYEFGRGLREELTEDYDDTE